MKHLLFTDIVQLVHLLDAAGSDDAANVRKYLREVIEQPDNYHSVFFIFEAVVYAISYDGKGDPRSPTAHVKYKT